MSDNFDEHARTFNRHGGIRGLANEIDALRAENEQVHRQLKLCIEEQLRLRAAAQAVIDSINDENEIDPDTIARLSQTLVSHKRA